MKPDSQTTKPADHELCVREALKMLANHPLVGAVGDAALRSFDELLKELRDAKA